MGKRKSIDNLICSQIGKTICSEIGKRLRSYKSIRSCTSPQSSLLNRRPDFNWFEEDIWTEIAKYLDGKCMVMLGSSCRWFRHLILEEDSYTDFCCCGFDYLRWSHSYLFRQQEKHIDWMRIGAFFFDSSAGLLTEKLPLLPRLPRGESVEKMLQTTGSCILNNIKTGIWIADLQLVRCPVCNLDTCEGVKKRRKNELTMQTLDARHIELFLTEGYKSGSWDYKEIGSYQIRTHSDGATGAIFDIMHLQDRPTAEVLDLKKWAAKPSDWQPKARVACHGVAVNTNLQQNDGLHVRYHAMRAGEEDDSEVVPLESLNNSFSFYSSRLYSPFPQKARAEYFILTLDFQFYPHISHIQIASIPFVGG
ncbi:hypothetical protein MKX01_022883 [Papaver californicum]|nr:hypothetical protein MKX01_022883 [Papaver californicum]